MYFIERDQYCISAVIHYNNALQGTIANKIFTTHFLISFSFLSMFYYEYCLYFQYDYVSEFLYKIII